MVFKVIIAWFILGLFAILEPIVNLCLKVYKYDKLEECERFIDKFPIISDEPSFILFSLLTEITLWPYFCPQVIEVCNECKEYCKIE